MSAEPCEVIAQTSQFVVVNKRHNLNFHDEDQPCGGLFSRVKAQLGLTELYPVHRLDKMTSGLIIFAKTLACAQQFQQLFAQHSVEKYYLAIADGKPKKKQGLIKGDMEKSRRGMFKLMRSYNNPAISQFLSYPLTSGRRLYLIKPHSGKTHQIRVALNSIGVPILGDLLYGHDTNAEHGYLHAFALRFTLDGRLYSFECPPQAGQAYLTPEAVTQIAQLSQPWLLAWPKI